MKVSVDKAKASHEIGWVNKINKISGGHFAVIKWSTGDITDDKLLAA